MGMTLRIDDDFDLEKIAKSGQCFRVKRFDDGAYRFISLDRVIYIKNEGEGLFTVSCDEKEWGNFWRGYFDLDTDYRGIAKEALGKNRFVDEAVNFGRGIRLLRQDPWETLITFIISQRRNIPAIAGSVEKLSATFGKPYDSPCERISLFPTPKALADADTESLNLCSLGYRTPYVKDAAGKVRTGELDLTALKKDGDDVLIEKLMKVKGVGVKVAGCVALFAYARTSCVPVDVWIKRVIEDDFGGRSPFHMYGKYAGVIQQYVYYYKRNGPRGQKAGDPH